jgi:hypothetical protein
MPHVNMLDAALRAWHRGWSVVPMHTTRGGRCSCGVASCPSLGKHPRVRWDDYQHRLPREDEVHRWWRRWPDANLGVVTGAVSGLVVIDVDPRSGGDEALVALEERFGALPATVECVTGGGGAHLYFRHPGGVVRSGPLVEGVDVKADGGVVMSPPSMHPSGTRYAWDVGASPKEHELVGLPTWLVDLPADNARDAGRHAGTSRAVAPRTMDERREFAQLWARFGVQLEAGDRYYLCPFHADHHPSLHIDAEGCRWYCFGCGRGGGPGRLRRIADRHGHRTSRVDAVLEDAARSRDRVARESVPTTWMQWPTLQPGGTQQVVGEAHYASALERLAHGRTWRGPRTRWFTARLAREHTNPHDPGAVRVDIGTDTVGYLPRADAPKFHPILEQLGSDQKVATTRARLTGGWERGPYGRGSLGVALDVDPRVIPCEADAPFLPPELTVPVRCTEQHHVALARLLGDAAALRTTARLLVPAGPSDTLRISIAGDEVGTLTGTVARSQLPIVQRVLAAGFPASCTATIEQRPRRPALHLHLPHPNTT